MQKIMIAITPKPPYYAVIFSSTLNENTDGYAEMAEKMLTLAKQQDGFLGVESARNDLGITVSYWKDLKAISAWKTNTDHAFARQKGREDWYKSFKVRIAKVEHDYEF